MKYRITVCDPQSFTDGVFEGFFPSLAHCIAAAARRGWNIRGSGAAMFDDVKWIDLDSEMHAALGDARVLLDELTKELEPS